MLLAIGAYIRLQVMETPAFSRVQERNQVARIPLRVLLAAQPKRLLLGMGTRFVEGFTFNLYSASSSPTSSPTSSCRSRGR